MRRKLSNKGICGFLRDTARLYNFEEFSFLSCGCIYYKVTGKAGRWTSCHRKDCGRLDAPRTCACGLNEELTLQTLSAHRLGDAVQVEKLRQQRRQHYEECGRE